MLGFAVLTPTYLEHAARMRFGCDRSDFFRDDYLLSVNNYRDLVDKLTSMQVLVAVADQGGFSAAAEVLRLSSEAIQHSWLMN